MTIDKLAAEIHDATGATGAELETMTFFLAQKMAILTKNEAAISHFSARMRESFDKWQGR